MNTCRICHEVSFHPENTMLRYGPRHWAHFACYLKAGKPLDSLSTFTLGRFPFRAVKTAGLESYFENRLGYTASAR